MAKFNAAKGNYEGKDFDLLPTDIYRMKIVKADIQQNTFAEKKEDDTYPDRLVLCWEVSQVLGDQDEGVIGLSVWQRMAPWYGDTRRGPSKFKTFIDSLIEQKLLNDDFDSNDMDTDWFVGMEQRVNVELYVKTMGANKGNDGNRVVSVMSLVPQRKAPIKAGPATPATAPRPVTSVRTAPRNVAQPVVAGGVEEEENYPF